MTHSGHRPAAGPRFAVSRLLRRRATSFATTFCDKYVVGRHLHHSGKLQLPHWYCLYCRRGLLRGTPHNEAHEGEADMRRLSLLLGPTSVHLPLSPPLSAAS